VSAISTIEWCDATWNPTRGCSIKSAGCANCFAMKQAHRFSGPGKPYEGLTRMGAHGPTWTGKVRLVPEALDWPLRYRGHPRAKAEGRPTRIFVNSMSDLFHESLADEEILSVFAVMALARQHTFQVLTKRPERMARLLGSKDTATAFAMAFAGLAVTEPGVEVDVRHIDDGLDGIRFPNVWLGVSVEDQATADERIPLLLQTPAAVRFVSYEPALGPVDFSIFMQANRTVAGLNRLAFGGMPVISTRAGLDWLIVGGESGPGARPCDVEWIRSAVRQCREAGVPVFVKQLGARPYHRVGDDPGLDGMYRLVLRDRKGSDSTEWPEDLRVREFPK
jgi:protein gp37